MKGRWRKEIGGKEKDAERKKEKEEIGEKKEGSKDLLLLPASAIADATSFWVENMLHAAHRTVAPSATSVSINTCMYEKLRERVGGRKMEENDSSEQSQVQGVSKKWEIGEK